MKESTKKVIFITLFSLLVFFTIGFSIYVNREKEKTQKELDKLTLSMYANISCLEGYKYGVKYLYNKNLVRQDTLIHWQMEGIALPVNKSMDSCTFEDYFFTSFYVCLVDACRKGYLVKKDSLVEKMMFDFDSIKTDYFSKIKK